MEYVAEYIRSEHPRGARVVEVGVGTNDAAATALAAAGYEVTATDVRDVSDEVGDSVRFVRDNVTQPDLGVYEGADVVYSVRPPYELHRPLRHLARRVDAHLVLAPLADETPDCMRLVNHDGTGRALYVVREP